MNIAHGAGDHNFGHYTGPRSSGGQDWRPSRIREGEAGPEDATTEETVESRRARLQHAPRRVRITPSNADTPSSDEEDTNSGTLRFQIDNTVGKNLLNFLERIARYQWPLR